MGMGRAASPPVRRIMLPGRPVDVGGRGAFRGSGTPAAFHHPMMAPAQPRVAQ